MIEHAGNLAYIKGSLGAALVRVLEVKTWKKVLYTHVFHHDFKVSFCIQLS